MILVLVIGKGSHESYLDLALVSRAFGASAITFCAKDAGDIRSIERAIKGTNSKWGGKFSVFHTKNWKEFINEKKNYLKIYLTMYGLPMKKLEYQIRTYKNILLIVSFTEAIKPLYRAADFNISITAQPHTCASAISVFLHNFYNGRELALHFENAGYKVVPEEHSIHIQKSKG